MFYKLIIKDIFFDKNICKYDKELYQIIKNFGFQMIRIESFN